MTDIFDEIDVPDDNQNTDPLATLAEKFGVQVTPETEKILRAKAESDAFIEQMKRENAELRQEVSGKATIDEILTRIRETSTQQQPQPSPNPGQNEQKAAIDNSQIEELVSNLLSKKELESRVQKNRRLVEEKLQEKWGADAQLQLNKKAKELGVDTAYLKRIAEENPAIFFSSIGLNQPAPQAQPSTAPRSGQSVQPQANGGTRNKAFYERLKATNRTEYFSPKVQNQMMKDALAMGDAFFA